MKLNEMIESIERLALNESLTEAVNHENDEINSLLRQYVGKKNIPSKAVKAIEDAGIQIEGMGDRIRFIGPHGKQLSGWGRTDRQGPKRPMTHSKSKWRKEQDQFRNSNWDLSQGRGYRGSTYYKEPEGDSWDKVDLKSYLDSNRNNTWYDYEEYSSPGSAGERSAVDYFGGPSSKEAASLRPYSDKYQNMKKEKENAEWDRDYNRKEYGILSDDEIEDRVRQFRDDLIRKNSDSKSKNQRAEDRYDKAVSDIDTYLRDLGVRK